MSVPDRANFYLADPNLELVAALYVKRWLRPAPPIPAEALAAVTAGPS